MPWIKFTKPFDYDFRPKASVCQHFEPTGKPVLVKTEIADAALAAGAAEKAKRPKRSE